MAARRLIAVLVVLLAVSTLLAVLAPDPTTDEDEGAPRDEAGRTVAEPAPGSDGADRGGGQARHLTRTIELDPGADGDGPTVRIAVGDQLTLTVRSPEPGQLELVGLGLVRDVSPEAPARFDILPFEPGVHPLRPLEGGEQLAEVRVVRRR